VNEGDEPRLAPGRRPAHRAPGPGRQDHGTPPAGPAVRHQEASNTPSSGAVPFDLPPCFPLGCFRLLGTIWRGGCGCRPGCSSSGGFGQPVRWCSALRPSAVLPAWLFSPAWDDLARWLRVLARLFVVRGLRAACPVVLCSSTFRRASRLAVSACVGMAWWGGGGVPIRSLTGTWTGRPLVARAGAAFLLSRPISPTWPATGAAVRL